MIRLDLTCNVTTQFCAIPMLPSELWWLCSLIHLFNMPVYSNFCTDSSCSDHCYIRHDGRKACVLCCRSWIKSFKTQHWLALKMKQTHVHTAHCKQCSCRMILPLKQIPELLPLVVHPGGMETAVMVAWQAGKSLKVFVDLHLKWFHSNLYRSVIQATSCVTAILSNT